MRRRFGPLDDQVPIIGQGTWHMGDPRHRRAEMEALATGLDLGLTHIDTAELYGDGRAEELIAETLRERRRGDVFLVSKVLPRHASRRGTIAACDASLARLRIDYLDVYLLHWPSRHPIAETMGAMEDLVRAGKIRALGVSNFDVPELEAAERALSRQRIACNQVLYHLGDRGIERRVLPYCRRRGIAVVGYSPFGSGDFDARPPLIDLARRRGATPRQLALAFLVREDGLFTIPKAARAAHVRENAATLDLRLTADELAVIDRAYPLPPDGPLPTL